MLSQMRLETFGLEELIFESDPFAAGETEVGESYQFDVDFSLQKHVERTAFRVRLVTEFLPVREKDESRRFKRLKIVIWGVFSFPEDTPEEFVHKVTPVNQLSILYGVARGIAGTVSGVSDQGMFVLPSLNFFEIVSQKLESEQDPESGRKKSEQRKRRKRKNSVQNRTKAKKN